MATITTFSTLKSAVADWLDRDDMSASGGAIDTMISLAEDKIYRELRLRFMEASTSPAIASGVIPIPGEFLELKQANINETGNVQVALIPKSNEWIYSKYVDRSSSGLPKFIAQEGDNFIFGPYPDSGYTVNLQFYAKPTRLGTSNETNWLTSNAADLLLHETLLQSIGYLGADERAPYWKAERDRCMEEIKKSQKRERYAGEMTLRMAPG